jgi:hypothetical protein
MYKETEEIIKSLEDAATAVTTTELTAKLLREAADRLKTIGTLEQSKLSMLESIRQLNSPKEPDVLYLVGYIENRKFEFVDSFDQEDEAFEYRDHANKLRSKDWVVFRKNSTYNKLFKK